MEKILAKNSVRGEKMTNIRYGGSMIRLLVPEIIRLNSRVVLDGTCDDDYDNL